ncbi:MAG: hypothetical protein V2A77_01040 [Pseudomonadota bacterium]
MIIKFNQPGEFIEELDQEYGKDVLTLGVPGEVRPTLRLTNEHRQTEVSPNITHLVVLATIPNKKGDIIKLFHFVGDLWGVGRDEEIVKKATLVHAQLEEAAKRLNIEVRGGVYEP